ncbi:MAG: Plug domain-containing protein, partial [Steroidobacteraceae bacterium]
MVTANRREQRAQDVPIAITALTAESTRERGIVDLQSLRVAIPALNFDRQTNAATPFLRGVGTQTGSLGNEPSVALYVDNVYIGTGMGSLFDFNNIERV